MNDEGCDEDYHRPAMLRRAIELLAVTKGVYVDATVGGGGHTEAILERLEQGLVIGIDEDTEALACATRRLGRFPNLRLVQGNFADMERIAGMAPEAAAGLAGVLFDLGLSRHQAVTPGRGFSYQAKGPLDMRFDQSRKPVEGGFETRPDLTAAELIQRSSEQDIRRILQDYGEERFARRIARQISRMRGRMNSTEDLSEVVRSATPPRFRSKSLMRVFQAFRVAVNDELENLRRGLDAAIRLLATNGRIVVISYQSLEDRVAKLTFREARAQGVLEVITRKPLRPQSEEVAANPSARSARLRAAARTTMNDG